MNVTVEIPEDRAARFERQAQSLGLTVDQWLLELAERNAPAVLGEAPPKRRLAEVCAKVRAWQTTWILPAIHHPVVTSLYERLPARHQHSIRNHS